jgi:hypothetical protein
MSREERSFMMDFAKLAQTFEELERTSSRLSLIELVTQLCGLD